LNQYTPVTKRVKTQHSSDLERSWLIFTVN